MNKHLVSTLFVAAGLLLLPACGKKSARDEKIEDCKEDVKDCKKIAKCVGDDIQARGKQLTAKGKQFKKDAKEVYDKTKWCGCEEK